MKLIVQKWNGSKYATELELDASASGTGVTIIPASVDDHTPSVKGVIEYVRIHADEIIVKYDPKSEEADAKK